MSTSGLYILGECSIATSEKQASNERCFANGVEDPRRIVL
jgi:hypothetical protein